MNSVVLLVDDEEAVLKGYKRNIGEMFEVETAPSGNAALEMIKANDKYALVLTDHRMPGITGIELLRKIHELRPNTVRMLITGYADLQMSLAAINEGSVFRMLTKPCNTQDFYKAIEAGLRQHELIMSEKELFEKTLNGSIQALGDILSVMDPMAFGRAQKLCLAAKELALAAGCENTWEIEIAATLSEIGRITLPGAVARKRLGFSQLEPAESELLTQLPEFSAKIVSHIPRLEPVSEIIRYQSKNFDGSGFPKDNLRGEYIPLGARILRFLNEAMLQADKDKDLLHFIADNLGADYKFDVQLVKKAQAIAGRLNQFVSKTLDSSATRTLVNVSELKDGMLLLGDIETKEGLLIIGAGNVLRPAILQRIKNFAATAAIKEPIAVTEYR